MSKYAHVSNEQNQNIINPKKYCHKLLEKIKNEHKKIIKKVIGIAKKTEEAKQEFPDHISHSVNQQGDEMTLSYLLTSSIEIAAYLANCPEQSIAPKVNLNIRRCLLLAVLNNELDLLKSEIVAKERPTTLSINYRYELLTIIVRNYNDELEDVFKELYEKVPVNPFKAQYNQPPLIVQLLEHSYSAVPGGKLFFYALNSCPKLKKMADIFLYKNLKSSVLLDFFNPQQVSALENKGVTDLIGLWSSEADDLKNEKEELTKQLSSKLFCMIFHVMSSSGDDGAEIKSEVKEKLNLSESEITNLLSVIESLIVFNKLDDDIVSDYNQRYVKSMSGKCDAIIKIAKQKSIAEMHIFLNDIISHEMFHTELLKNFFIANIEKILFICRTKYRKLIEDYFAGPSGPITSAETKSVSKALLEGTTDLNESFEKLEKIAPMLKMVPRFAKIFPEFEHSKEFIVELSKCTKESENLLKSLKEEADKGNNNYTIAELSNLDNVFLSELDMVRNFIEFHNYDIEKIKESNLDIGMSAPPNKFSSFIMDKLGINHRPCRDDYKEKELISAKEFFDSMLGMPGLPIQFIVEFANIKNSFNKAFTEEISKEVSKEDLSDLSVLEDLAEFLGNNNPSDDKKTTILGESFDLDG